MTNKQIDDLCAQISAAAFSAACREFSLAQASGLADGAVECFKKKFDFR